MTSLIIRISKIETHWYHFQCEYPISGSHPKYKLVHCDESFIMSHTFSLAPPCGCSRINSSSSTSYSCGTASISRMKDWTVSPDKNSNLPVIEYSESNVKVWQISGRKMALFAKSISMTNQSPVSVVQTHQRTSRVALETATQPLLTCVRPITTQLSHTCILNRRSSLQPSIGWFCCQSNVSVLLLVSFTAFISCFFSSVRSFRQFNWVLDLYSDVSGCLAMTCL